MLDDVLPADVAVLDLLRERRAWSIAELSQAMEVTATAVRQRLNRLMAQGYVERVAERVGRGRPSHTYSLTAKGRQQSGTNFADLATVLWQEVRHLPDMSVRRGLMQRIAGRLAAMYQERLSGVPTEGRMEAVAAIFAERRVPMSVTQDAVSKLPVLQAHSCPYPDLAEQDRGVCAMERMLFSELVGHTLTLSECRLDGDSCCSFTPTQGSAH